MNADAKLSREPPGAAAPADGAPGQRDLARRGRDALAGLFAEQRRHWRRLWNASRVFELACTTRVGATPHDVVLSDPAFDLLRYRRSTPAAYAQPLLLCYALINRAYILDLQPDKSVVERYLAQGFDVYMIDWRAPADADRGRTLDDHVRGALKRAVGLILRDHRRADLHILGYCMGGTMAALFAALDPGPVRSLTLLAAPIDFGGRDSLLNLWTDPQIFDVDAFVATHGNCPTWFLQSCFTSTKPVQNILEKPIAFYELLDDTQGLSSYFAMERWINDNVPVAGETFREFVKKLYQGNELVRGTLHLGPDRVDLGRVSCPLLLVTAQRDHLVAPPATEGIRPHVGSRDVQSMTIDAGHVGLVVGGKAQRGLWPEAARWLAERSTPSC